MNRPVPSLLIWDPATMGANSNNNQETKELSAAEKEDVKQFKKSLPDVKKQQEKLQSLEFFALCPNGKRIPVAKICEEYATDPNGLAMRTFDDRLVLVIQAMFPGETIPYWNQAFYLSTGESSGMGGTWLPFNGILMRGDRSRTITVYHPKFEHRNRKAEEKKLIFSGWFSKDELCAPQNRSYTISRWMQNKSVEQLKKEALEDTFGRFYLPEGNYMHYKSSYDRFGTLSFVMASHAMGGRVYKYKMGTDIVYRFGTMPVNTSANTAEMKIARKLNVDNPLQSCFETMSSTYPISKPYEVNAYIDKYHATFIMNSFRQENIFPPGLGFLNTPFQALGYSMPLFGDWFALASYVGNTWDDYQLGKITLEEVKKRFTDTHQAVLNSLKKTREHCIVANEPGYTFNIDARLRENATKEKYKYYGGKQTRRNNRSKKRRQTRRH